MVEGWFWNATRGTVEIKQILELGSSRMGRIYSPYQPMLICYYMYKKYAHGQEIVGTRKNCMNYH